MDRPPFEETHPHLKRFSEFLDEFNAETERGAVLVAAALLDEVLKDILQAFLMPNKGTVGLFGGKNAPLGTFSARTDAAFAMGLILEKEHREASLIRRVRNAFAHALGVSFSDQKIVNLCRELTGSIKPTPMLTIISPRSLFSSAAVSLLLNLNNRAHYAGKKRLDVLEFYD